MQIEVIFWGYLAVIIGVIALLTCKGKVLYSFGWAIFLNFLSMKAARAFGPEKANLLNSGYWSVSLTILDFLMLLAMLLVWGKRFQATRQYGISRDAFTRSRGAFTQNVAKWAKPRESQKAPVSAEERGYRRVNQ